jgi:hypothetical protein
MLLGSASVYDVLTFLLYRVYLCICQYCWDHPVCYRSLNFLFCPIGTPTVTVPDPTYSVNRGSAITLQCSYSANPPATQVRWRKNNVDLGDTAGNAKYGGSTTASASLIIYNAAESDEGTYVCTVTNTVGTGISTTTTLDVVGSKYCNLCLYSN